MTRGRIPHEQEADGLPTYDSWHPAILRAVQRHREFHEGSRRWLVSVSVAIEKSAVEGQDRLPDFDDMDWHRDFDLYVEVRHERARRAALSRLEMDIDDDWLPGYFPYFGAGIHSSYFRGCMLHHGGGTSYAHSLIESASQSDRLVVDLDGFWPRLLARGLAYARDHADGILPATLRGGNGPMDMANAVLGNVMFTEFYDAPDAMQRLMAVCTECLKTVFAFQKSHCSQIVGGYVAPMGPLWIPSDSIGHISLDAACLTGPDVFQEFEQPHLKALVPPGGGLVIHTHMLGRKAFGAMCATPGWLLFAPADDPGQPPLVDECAQMLDAIGQVPLLLRVPLGRLNDVLPMLQGHRVVVCVDAATDDEARRVTERVRSAER